MAEKEYELQFKWENNDHFTARCKKEGEDWLTIISIDENTHIKDIWGFIESICSFYFNSLIKEIGNEMKA